MKLFEQCMRWYGPDDPVSLADIRQAGATGVVTALHHIPNGVVWQPREIKKRKDAIEAMGMKWAVVESLPVHENIKTHKGAYQTYIEHYKTSIENLSEAGIKTICYNFMAVLDWTRTNAEFMLPNGAKALSFSKEALTAFDGFILKRPGAAKAYTESEWLAGEDFYMQLSDEGRRQLEEIIIAGLPGSEEGYELTQFRTRLLDYEKIGKSDLAANLKYFLDEVIPVAEASGVTMGIHPDDPPFPIFGLPRVASTAEDFLRIVEGTPSPANGITFCSGSLGVRKENDLLEMIADLGEYIHFVHLRNIIRNNGGFYESDHLEGEVPMYEVVKAFSELQERREISLPMRPDHGHRILDDLEKTSNPGYTAIGRLKGLAELRGLELGIAKSHRTT